MPRSGSSRLWWRSMTRARRPWRRRLSPRCEGSVVGKKIAVLGLTYKPGTDDMRDAPSLVIVPELQAAGAHVVAYDPEGAKFRATTSAGRGFCGQRICLRAGRGRGCRDDRMGRISRVRPCADQGRLAKPVLVDLRNIYSSGHDGNLGFRYVGVGVAGSRAKGSRRRVVFRAFACEA